MEGGNLVAYHFVRDHSNDANILNSVMLTYHFSVIRNNIALKVSIITVMARRG